MNICVDKRMEILVGLILAYKKLTKYESEELDFVEFPNTSYAKELVQKINIEKYPEINKFIEDKSFDCGYYINLFVYFDAYMNFADSYKVEVFKVGSNKDFAKIIKRIYDNENLEAHFKKNEEELKKMLKPINNIINIDLSDINSFYGVDNIYYTTVLSSLINGGFSSPKDNYLTYVRGLSYDGKRYGLNCEYFIVCLFHEFSHPFINPLVDKYFDAFTNLDSLYQESIEKGLPKTYQNKKTLLYEYFVRVNSIVLAKKYITQQEIEKDIEWFKKIGFNYSTELIELVEENFYRFQNYEELFINILIPYINEIIKTKNH